MFRCNYLLIAAFVVATGQFSCSTFKSESTESITTLAVDPDQGGLHLKPNFSAVVVADSIGRARHIAVRPNGDVYVKMRNLNDGKGITALRDTDGDGRADRVEGFGDYGGTGIEFHNEHLYASSDTAIYRYAFSGDELVPGGAPELIVSGFPVQKPHASKPMAFDQRGHMYVTIGAPTNACEEGAFAPASPGVDPCPALENHAGIWRFDASRANQKYSPDARYAQGVRNALALHWNSRESALYAVVHGRDQLGGFWPEKFDQQQNAELPAEQFIRVEENQDYGWPYCYFDPEKGQFMLSPEYGGDGETTGRCTDLQAPLLSFPAHSAPNDLLFYTGDMFPAEYKNGAFVALHGSWNRAPFVQAGYMVVFVPFENGVPSGPWEAFITGFAGMDEIMTPAEAAHRPMGLAQGPDGSLYITDSVKGKIWRIVYNKNVE
jgi:glucose/arabinose dehydrogenase